MDTYVKRWRRRGGRWDKLYNETEYWREKLVNLYTMEKVNEHNVALARWQCKNLIVLS